MAGAFLSAFKIITEPEPHIDRTASLEKNLRDKFPAYFFPTFAVPKKKTGGKH